VPTASLELRNSDNQRWTRIKRGREAPLSSITADDLAAALTGDPEALDVHLSLVERDLVIDGCLVKIHCHCLTVDGNGRVQARSSRLDWLGAAAIDRILG
jgi:hypothetical protein